MFTQYCKDKGDDVSRFPLPSDICVDKMVDGLVNMSDHCVVAFGLKTHFSNLVRNLAEAKYTQEYLDGLLCSATWLLLNYILLHRTFSLVCTDICPRGIYQWQIKRNLHMSTATI
jgi:hypothetical protein